MGLIILLALIGMPILEIAVFIDVGERIGLFNTIAIVILTAIAGTALLRWQGLSVLSRAQSSLRENRFPLQEVFDGLCLVLAGALLLTPGFVTDTIGFLLFFPPLRLILKSIAARMIAKRANIHMQGGTADYPGPDNGIIDGDFQDITDDETPANKDLSKITDKDPPE